MASTSHHKRLMTAAVLLPCLGVAVYLGGWYLFALILAFALIGQWEFYGMYWPEDEELGIKTVGLVLGAMIVFSSKVQLHPRQDVILGMVAFWTAALGFLFAYAKDQSRPRFGDALALLGGLFYVPVMLRSGVDLRTSEIVLLVISVMASDAGAYYAGSILGGPKVWPVISPKKTWAGSLGGLTACVAVCGFFGAYYGRAPIPAFMALGVMLNLAAQFGDFFESALKRSMNVKDSGSILPGHGGVLDRIDSLLLVLPVYVCIKNLYVFF